MYESFFGLKNRPFSKTPDPKFIFYSKSHEEAFARLQHAVEEKELVLLTGEVGSGKTTLSRALMDSLGECLKNIRGLGGAAEIGRHEIVLVLDVENMMEEAFTRNKVSRAAFNA